MRNLFYRRETLCTARQLPSNKVLCGLSEQAIRGRPIWSETLHILWNNSGALISQIHLSRRLICLLHIVWIHIMNSFSVICRNSPTSVIVARLLPDFATHYRSTPQTRGAPAAHGTAGTLCPRYFPGRLTHTFGRRPFECDADKRHRSSVSASICIDAIAVVSAEHQVACVLFPSV